MTPQSPLHAFAARLRTATTDAERLAVYADIDAYDAERAWQDAGLYPSEFVDRLISEAVDQLIKDELGSGDE